MKCAGALTLRRGADVVFKCALWCEVDGVRLRVPGVWAIHNPHKPAQGFSFALREVTAIEKALPLPKKYCLTAV